MCVIDVVNPAGIYPLTRIRSMTKPTKDEKRELAYVLMDLYRDFYVHLAKEKADDLAYSDLELFIKFLYTKYPEKLWI